MKKFVRKRLKEIGIKREDFIKQVGCKRDLHPRINTMENKLKELSEFFETLECEVIIVLKKRTCTAILFDTLFNTVFYSPDVEGI